MNYGSGRLAACHHPLNLKRGALSKATISEESPAGAADALPSEPGKADLPVGA